MTTPELINRIKKLYNSHFGFDYETLQFLPFTASGRKYFRLVHEDHSCIATYNSDIVENEAFFHIQEALFCNKVNVPKVICVNRDKTIYLQEDIGDETLLTFVERNRKNGNSAAIKEIYKKIIEALPLIQVETAKNIDFAKCYPREAFDRQSIQWDLNYFKYLYLKVAGISFHEQKLEDDFQKLIDFLLEAPSSYFLYRDFQSRNIMVLNNEVYFIDFQGGRKGALQYDLASLLFEGKANLDSDFRKEFLNYYKQEFSRFGWFNAEEFEKYYPAFVLARILQAFGAYGYRGLIEKKALFVQSIVPGLKNLKELLDNYNLYVDVPHLKETIFQMIEKGDTYLLSDADKLTVTISSFSYKKGIPEDYSGNGGGFVFDCRWITNPIAAEHLKDQTGRDLEVKAFIDTLPDAGQLFNSALDLVSGAIKKYQSRNFKNLNVSFGCTGGQHRSVYMAEKLTHALIEQFDVRAILQHRELKIKEVYGEGDV